MAGLCPLLLEMVMIYGFLSNQYCVQANPNPCSSYTTITDPTRLTTYVHPVNKCDGSITVQWYRLSGGAGDRMPTSCVPKNRCNTDAPGWLSQPHPTVAEGIVYRTVCFHWSNSCCHWSNTIRVRNCGAFYVYEFQPTPVNCDLRYCGWSPPSPPLPPLPPSPPSASTQASSTVGLESSSSLVPESTDISVTTRLSSSTSKIILATLTTTASLEPSSTSAYRQSSTTASSTISSNTVRTTTATTTKPAPTAPADPDMYPYGIEAGDYKDDRYNDEWKCIQFFLGIKGFPFYGKIHYKLHVCRNGLMSFEEEWYRWWPYNFGQYYWFDHQSMLAPYWSTIDNIDAFRDGTSKLYFQVYKKGDGKSSTASILRRATYDVNQHTREHQLPTEFGEASWVMVVTWVKIRHWYSRWWEHLRDLYNTFQAVLITNGVYSFVMYNYPENGIQWSAPARRSNYERYWNARGLPVIGFNAGDYKRHYYNHPRSGRVTIVDIDNLEGVNIHKSPYSHWFETTLNGKSGRIFIRLEESRGKTPRMECIDWYYGQPYAYWYRRDLEPCPCTYWQARRDRRFFMSKWDWPRRCFYSSFPSRYGWGQECCYKFFRRGWWWWWWSSWSSYLAVGYPDGGNAHRYHKYRWPWQHQKDDVYFYEQCCIYSKMCWMYQQRRPSDRCWGYRPPWWSWFWGDPHFVTLDNKNYTFNGLGEFVMLDAKEGHFQLQARTKLAKGEGTATVFCGAVAKETNTSTVQVTLTDNGTMEVYVDGKSFDIIGLTNTSQRLNGSVTVVKPETNCFEMGFPSGMSVKVCEKLKQLSIIAAAPESFKNHTKGLLGTWNGNSEDDFTLPNGTVLPGSCSGRDIHYNFGLAWQVTSNISLFTYKPWESVNSFVNASFKPMFVEDITFANDSLKAQAESLCKGDISCMFDVASTNDLEVGESTKQINSQLVNDSKKMSNEPPTIDNSSSVLYLNIRETVKVIVNASDPDGDDITFNVTGLPDDASVNTKAKSIEMSWKVTSSKLDVQYIVTDSNEAVSSIKPTMYLCACQHGGNCYKPNITLGSNSSDDKFIRMLCSCSQGYTGRYCESDIDACEANLNPCYPGVKCVDLPAPANMTSGYECGPCPSGYTGSGAACTDIDECKDGKDDCSQKCGNTPGLFVCSCNHGYQLNIDRRTCDDVNECLPVSDCMHKCTNTIGSYSCSCNENFKVDPNNNKLCVPKNPCKDNDHGCQHVCYMDDENKQKCACNRGYKLNDDSKTCSDIDECTANQYRCNQKCHNTKGSYTCSCVTGFELSADNITCVDINECMRWTFNCTDFSQICENTPGSYKCVCEEGLYWINSKCTGLKPGESIPPPPVAPTPKEPSKNEAANAVNMTMTNLDVSQWNKPKEDNFKQVVAEGVTTYCAKNEGCHPSTKRAKRSAGFVTFGADQVHLLPGFPLQIVSDKYPATSLAARIAIYVNFPLGMVLESDSTLNWEILLKALKSTRKKIEKALNVSILALTGYRPEQPLSVQEEKEDNTYIIIGASVGGGVVGLVILMMIIVGWYKKKRHEKVGMMSNDAVEMKRPPRDDDEIVLQRHEEGPSKEGLPPRRGSSHSSRSRVSPL